MNVHLGKSIVISFIFVFCILFGLGLFSFISIQRLLQTVRLLRHAALVINTGEETIKHLTDIETGVRGFIITGDSAFLQPYQAGMEHIPGLLAKMDSLTQPYPKQKRLVSQLQQQTEHKIKNSQYNIEARLRSFQEAAALVQNYTGKKIMDSLRNTVQIIQSNERDFYQAHATFSVKHLSTVQYSVSLLFISVLITITILFYALNKSSHQREQKTQMLRALSTELGDLYNLAPCGYVSFDRNYKVTNVNNTLANMMGYKKEEIMGILNINDIVVPNNESKTFDDNWIKYNHRHLEFDCIKKGNRHFPVILQTSVQYDEQGSFTKCNATIMDDTDRKLSENKFRNFLDSSPDALIIVTPEGIIQVANKQCQEIFGYTKDELIGQCVDILLPESLRLQHVQHRSDFIRKPGARPMGGALDLKAIKKNGTEFPVEISLSPITTEDGILVSAAVRDVTKQKQQLQHIQQLNDDLNAFTYSVSHDLRAPLRLINGFANILAEDHYDQLNEEGKKVLSTIIRHAVRMGFLIDDMLRFSKLGRQGIVKNTLHMEELVRQLITDLPSDIQNKTQIKIGKLATAKADPDMIKQVWSNYLLNAIKFSGKVESPQIEIGSYLEKQEIIYFVHDNGIGFDENYKHKLFGVFQRLHKLTEFEGTGVGLAIVKRIIEKHQGRVWAESQPGAGATFFFSIPVL